MLSVSSVKSFRDKTPRTEHNINFHQDTDIELKTSYTVLQHQKVSRALIEKKTIQLTSKLRKKYYKKGKTLQRELSRKHQRAVGYREYSKHLQNIRRTMQFYSTNLPVCLSLKAPAKMWLKSFSESKMVNYQKTIKCHFKWQGMLKSLE